MSWMSHLPFQLRSQNKDLNNIDSIIDALRNSVNQDIDLEPQLVLAKLKHRRLKAITAVAEMQSVLAKMDILIAAKELKLYLERLQKSKTKGNGVIKATNKKSGRRSPFKPKYHSSSSKSGKSEPKSLHNINKLSTKVVKAKELSKSGLRTNCKVQLKERKQDVYKKQEKNLNGPKNKEKSNLGTCACDKGMKQKVTEKKTNATGNIQETHFKKSNLIEICNQCNAEPKTSNSNQEQRYKNVKERKGKEERSEKKEAKLVEQNKENFDIFTDKPAESTEQPQNMIDIVNKGQQETIENIYKEVMKMMHQNKKRCDNSTSSASTEMLCLNCGYVNDDHQCPYD